jgi:hypothetical protein
MLDSLFVKKTTLFITPLIRFRRWSFLKITSFSKNQTNTTLTFCGNLIFHLFLVFFLLVESDIESLEQTNTSGLSQRSRSMLSMLFLVTDDIYMNCSHFFLEYAKDLRIIVLSRRP